MRYIFFIYFHQNLGTVRAASRTSEDVPSSSTTTISRDTPIPQPQVSKSCVSRDPTVKTKKNMKYKPQCFLA